MRATRNRHDCANDGTCGKSIQSRKISDTDISFFDGSGKLITKVPKLPKYSGDKYVNRLYKEAESKQFHYPPTDIQNVLPNSLTVKHGYINCTVKYDSLSEQEQNQIETDIKNAYEAFKEKFCLENSNASYNITVYIFNNRSDYTKYNDLLGINADGGPGYITMGVTDYRNILTYKQDSMDAVLGHELGHIFQLRFSLAGAVRNLHLIDTEFIANVIGRETEEKNYRAICKWLGVDEYSNYGPSGFKFKYKGTAGSVLHKNLSEEEKFQIIQHIKDYGLDEYRSSEWGLRFKYKKTISSIRCKNLSEEEKLQIVQRFKDYGLDKYESTERGFAFKYKGTTSYVRRENLSEEEKFQIIQRFKDYGL
ncbi:MAG: collagenase, partial [Wolbachia endosymbiont of Melophagus ovinus]|nr:collagenase [Wolbachia endosymbiont of Melophagus ovinus]